jgi:hypothetical protein
MPSSQFDAPELDEYVHRAPVFAWKATTQPEPNDVMLGLVPVAMPNE